MWQSYPCSESSSLRGHDRAAYTSRGNRFRTRKAAYLQAARLGATHVSLIGLAHSVLS